MVGVNEQYSRMNTGFFLLPELRLTSLSLGGTGEVKKVESMFRSTVRSLAPEPFCGPI